MRRHVRLRDVGLRAEALAPIVAALLTLPPAALAQEAQRAGGQPRLSGSDAGPRENGTIATADQASGLQPVRRPPPPNPTPAFTIRGHVDAGFLAFTASDAMDAVYDRHGGFAWGGGVRVTHRRGWFGQVSAARFAATGERVFVVDREVFPLGIASELTIVPVDVTAGWRFVPATGTRRPPPKPAPAPPPTRTGSQPPTRPAAQPARPRPRPRLVPYLGGGIGVVRVTERADFAETGDDVDETHTSYHVLGGADVNLGRWYGIGVEGGWRWVPDALAGSGVAEAFDETDLHHFFVTLRFTIGR